jgi:rubrerythrin
MLSTEAVRARYAGEHVPVYQRLAEIENTVEKRLRETVEVSPWSVSGVHWLCKICGHLDPAMRGRMGR